jgi:acyl-CoA synthetase (NDP forming)
MEKLRGIVPEAGSIAGNPLDLWMTFLDPSCLGRILDLAMEDTAVHVVMVDRLIPRKIYHMPEVEDPTPRFVKLLLEKRPCKPVVMTLDSEGGDPELSAKGAEIRASFCRAGIPAYPSVQRAARALRHRWQCGNLGAR